MGFGIDLVIFHVNLRTLYLGANRLPALPEWLGGFTYLEELDKKLSNPAVTSLPDYLDELPALEKIEIVGCDIKTIPPSIKRLIDSGELTLFKTEGQFNAHQWTHGERKKPRRMDKSL